MTSGSIPAVSVVMAVRETEPALERCLESLSRQTMPGSEVIVAGAGGRMQELTRRYPAVTFLPGNSLDEPALLKSALMAARGEIVAVTNAHCVFPGGWLENLAQAHRCDFPVIGGAVQHAGPAGLPAWVCYIADYAAFVPAAERCETSILAGNHISYRRSVLLEHEAALRDGYWKVFLLEEFSRRGMRCLFEPKLVIECYQDAGFLEFGMGYLKNAFRFATARTAGFTGPARLAHILTAPALPALLFYRRVRAVWNTKINRPRLILAMPLLFVLTLFWSAGELAGYLRGKRRA